VSYADDPLNATLVKAVHIREVRTRSTSGAGNSTSGGSSGGLHYVLSDLQGSTRAAMNNNGSSSSVVARHDYLPFGEEIGGIGGRTTGQGYTATDQNRWKYGMTERDATSGLDHTLWRKYESTSGRWTSPDPYSGSMSVANPQSFNRYSYTHNDPISFVDPTGLVLEVTDNFDCQRAWEIWQTQYAGFGDGTVKGFSEFLPGCVRERFDPLVGDSGSSPGGGIDVKPKKKPGPPLKPTTPEKTKEQKQKEYDDCYRQEMAPAMLKLQNLMSDHLFDTVTNAVPLGGLAAMLKAGAPSAKVWGSTMGEVFKDSAKLAGIGIITSLSVLKDLIKWRIDLANFDKETFTPAMKAAEATCKKKAGL